MGAWDYGPFDNDGALDFVGDLADGQPGAIVESLRRAMNAFVDAEQYRDVDEAEAAIVAAALLAGRLGVAVDSPSAADLLDTHPFDVDDDLRSRALRVFDVLFEPKDNEWYALWDEAGAIPEVRERLRPYREAIAPGTGESGPA